MASKKGSTRIKIQGRDFDVDSVAARSLRTAVGAYMVKHGKHTTYLEILKAAEPNFDPHGVGNVTALIEEIAKKLGGGEGTPEEKEENS